MAGRSLLRLRRRGKSGHHRRTVLVNDQRG